ncbi:tyrosine-type recombinase/integrase [Hamadaea tsunoensis]|uniref:tyrosine-type recombinase/integrase n=1 Tax=Hamadaea tsunoensis TaxID=53368 RepID=UPI00041C2C62|nr:tyrosine-type recombinase/integrase [Hamadaea tsunoensis]
MAVIDLWYLKARGPDKKRTRSKTYGRGRRYRVDYEDAAGNGRSRTFDHINEAKDFDASCRTGAAPEVKTDRATEETTFPAYAETWRSAHSFHWELETQKRIPSNIRYHLAPAFPGHAKRIRQTDVVRWLSDRLTDAAAPTPPSSMKLYYELFNTIMKAALRDGVIDANPCDGIRLATIFKAVSSRPRWVPDEGQIVDLYDAIPPWYRVAHTLGAKHALRIGEALAIEDSPRCLDFANGKLHVVQQLGYSNARFGGFFLKEPKAGSSGTIDFDSDGMIEVQDHINTYGSTPVEVVDAIDPSNIHRRVAKLIIVDRQGRPFHDTRWSEYWIPWRKAAGWPADGGTFHALRHFCATILLGLGVDPQHVQAMLRHASLQTTLAIYSHWLPSNDRPKDAISQVLKRARERKAFSAASPVRG